MFDDNSFAQRLQGALDETVREFNRSRDPDTAIAKVACDYGFTPAGTQRLVETFNRARTIFHFNTAEDKTAEFKLADPSTVAQLMYSPKAETKQASLAETIDLDQVYCRPETDYTKSALVEFVEKVASTETSQPVPLENLHARVMMQKQWFSKAAETALNLAYTANQYAERDLEKVAKAMITAAPDTDSLRNTYALLKEACARGSDLAPVCTELADYFERGYRIQESAPQKFASVIDTGAVEPYLKRLSDIRDLRMKCAGAEAVLEGMKKDAEEFNKLANTLLYHEVKESEKPDDFLIKRSANGAEKPGAKPRLSGQSLLPDVSPLTKANPMHNIGSVLDMDLLRAVTGADIARKNKELSATMTNVHRQAMLEDLLTNDPVLSEADPGQVISAYQGLLGLAPEVANMRPTVTAILRQTIHSQDAYGPFESDQLAKLNNALRTVRGLPSASAPKSEVHL